MIWITLNIDFTSDGNTKTKNRGKSMFMMEFYLLNLNSFPSDYFLLNKKIQQFTNWKLRQYPSVFSNSLFIYKLLLEASC